MTDSESHSLSEKVSRGNSATYSIHSLDDVPVRKSAVQIIRERSSDLFPHPPGSPRKRGTMQITKLVLKDPPKSPPRRKITPVVIKSIQTYTSAALTNFGAGTRDIPSQVEANGRPKPEEDFKIIPLMNAGHLLEQFEAQKNERNQASNEFQSYLVESFNKENKERSALQISKLTSPSDGSANAIASSATEVKAKSDSSTTTTATSSSSNATATATGTSKSSDPKTPSASTATSSSSTAGSSNVPPPPPPVATMPPSKPEVRRTARPKTMEAKVVTPAADVKKEKSYDPQKAREYIKEQQAKRKQEKRTSGPPACEKDLIRKRLDDLRRNTQVLVNKNVQKARKRSLSATPGGGSSQKSGTPLRALESGGSRLPPQKPLRKSVSTSSLKLVTPAASSVRSVTATRRRSSLLKPDLSEKMGIMRKPEDVPLGDVLVSPLRVVTPPSPPKFGRVDELGMRLMEVNEADKSSGSVRDMEKELKLDVPEVTLVPDSLAKVSVAPVEAKGERKDESKMVPPWFKHTLLQPDPYPFIIAVRKKLEAVRILSQSNRPEESAIAKPKELKSSQRCEDYLQTLKSVPYVSKPSTNGGDGQNISSISQQTSASNTTSEISSIKSDFILPLPPLSSTKIDTSPLATAPSVRPQISPLSMDRISNLKITALDSSLLERSVNFNRGSNMPNADLIPDRASFNARHVADNLHQSQLSLNTSAKQRNFLQQPSDKSAKELDYQRMLEAFNRSLSQVIEVNQQLYSAIKKPAEDRVKIRDEMTQTTPVSSVVAATNGSANSNYTDDFVQQSQTTTTVSSDSSPQKEPFTTSSSSSSDPSTSSSGISPEESSSKTHSSESQLLDSRSFSLSDSHNTNPPMPEEYLPSFEESLRRQEVFTSGVPAEKVKHSTSIETQISDEVRAGEPVLRDEVKAVKSVESISLKISVESDVSNEVSPPEVQILKAATSSSSSSELDALNAGRDSEREDRLNDTTMGSDILTMFNRTDLEISVMSTTVSEANLSYSSIGLYDQLIQSEKSKTDQLASRARLKEKALLDRTKGQLAWLELQKQRYRERGMVEQISATKKKQRAILVRLEKQRAELNKFKRSTPEVVPSRASGGRSPMTHKSIEKLNSFSSASNSISLRKSAGSGRSEIGSPQFQQQQQRKVTTTTTTTTTMMAAAKSVGNSQLQLAAAVRGVELEPSESLENILQRREQELQKRRQHVQALLEWHRKLDQEEQEIRDIEQNLLQYNREKVSEKQEKLEVLDETRAALGRIRSIEQSLQTLQQIPDQQQPKQSELSDEEVHASGGKLNRLWYRLTGVKEAKYDPTRSYTLTKVNLESLYEEAKVKVLEGFRGDESMRRALLDQSISGINSTGSVGNVSVIERKEPGVEVVDSGELLSDASSFKTTLASTEQLAEVVDEKDKDGSLESSSEKREVFEEEHFEEDLSSCSLPDVDEIISRVSDITENMNGLLSSTTNLDEILNSNQDKHVSESVEFHTTVDEEPDSMAQASVENHYSSSFDVPTIEEQHPELAPTAANDSQLMIEDISLPPLMDDSQLMDGSIAESVAESSEKNTASEEIPDEASLEEASSTASSATTPTTAEETETEYNEVAPADGKGTPPAASELEKRLILLNDTLGELSDSFEQVPLMKSPEVPRESRQSSSESEPGTSSTIEEDFLGNNIGDKPFLKPNAAETSPEGPKIEIKIRNKNVNENFPHAASSSSYLTPPASAPSTSVAPAPSPTTNRMPDIINEAEVLRRQQLQIEQEIKQLEQQVVFFREIPNKPPPPYIPPANGSPLALIFPPEKRINELIEDRTRDLFQGKLNPEQLDSDHVTNIYEKLILDMCKELCGDLRAPTPDVSFRMVKHKRPLAFYNPPDHLACLQDHMTRKIKKILNEESLLAQQQQQQNLHHCPMPFLMFSGGGAKRKRDQVDEILAQEMFDEEPRWTNFDREEIEVKERIVEELVKTLVSDALQDMEGAWREKHGGKGVGEKLKVDA